MGEAANVAVAEVAVAEVGGATLAGNRYGQLNQDSYVVSAGAL